MSSPSAPRTFIGVTISSTFTDLEEHRQILINSAIEYDMFPLAMEHDAAKDMNVIESSLRLVREGAAYIGIIGHKYGQVPESKEYNPDRLSITELEFNEAVRLKRPIILFFMGDDHLMAKRDLEADPAKMAKLDAFRERAKRMEGKLNLQRVYATFNTLEEFQREIAKALHTLSGSLGLVAGLAADARIETLVQDIAHHRLGQIKRSWINFWAIFLVVGVLVTGVVSGIMASGQPMLTTGWLKFLILELLAASVVLFYNVFTLRNEKGGLLYWLYGEKATESKKGASGETVSSGAADTKHPFESSQKPEQIFTTIAIVFAGISAVITSADLVTLPVPGWLYVLNHLLIFCVLLITTLFFFLRYRQVLADYASQGKSFNENLNLLNKLIVEQSGFYYEVMRHTRQAIYSQLKAESYPHRFTYQNPRLREVMDHSLDKVVAIVEKMITNQFIAHKHKEQISLSVKVIVKGNMAKALCKLSDEDQTGIKNDEEYIITLTRDHTTATLFSEREVRRRIYDKNANTDFNRILAGEPDYLCNDLASEPGYVNDNPQWREWYNAALVVPIVHRDGDQEKTRRQPFGFLTVDSKNAGNYPDLFTRAGTKPIMAFGADLLALIFLNLELFDNMDTNGIRGPAHESSGQSV